MSTELNIDSAFIQENKDLCKVVQKKHAPYSKKDRITRRNEVYRLHFELGWPAVRIADTMKIHRNTINTDIEFWYDQLAKQWIQLDFFGFVMKQINRLEKERSRLLEMLEKEKDIATVLSIERLIIDIDYSLNNIFNNTLKSRQFIWDQVTNALNKHAKEHNLDVGWYGYWELLQLSAKKHEKLNKFLGKDD